jgi:3-phosphoshikimate 1-carboxyvinyltransferase
VLLGAVAEGPTTVRGFLRGEDCLATLAAMRAMGVGIDEHAGELRIHGVGAAGLQPPDAPLDLGNSGTAMRLMAGLLAGQRFACELTGDESLRRRPMERVADPLRRMGARIQTTDGHPPLRISGGFVLKGIDYTLPIASAQVKSAVLIAALCAQGRTTVRSPAVSRDHTERMLISMGADLRQESDLVVGLDGPAQLAGREIDVPADLSSAAFFIVAALLGGDPGLLLPKVGVNPTRTGLLTILRDMGARIEQLNPGRYGAEPVADLSVERSELHGIHVGGDLVALSIDEIPVLCIAAACATGSTVITDAAELRHKETDRIAVMAKALRAMGVDVEEREDGMVVHGGRIRGGCVDSCGDHRIAMACAIASLAADQEIKILHTAEVATSFPQFVETAVECGLDLTGLDGP